ncbi:MAG: glycosyltransferase [Lachnospiraceae bacterium]|nr:glycosyltransferase [Lachnospiraceae bacterium]
MKFSIIVVVYNDLYNLKITCKSIIKQEFDNYELLIVDGNSTDGTQMFLQRLSAKNNHVRYLSEPDKGIYDAMNKGVLHAKGDYIVFLGAGDRFFNNHILCEIEELLNSGVDVLYGRCVVTSGKKRGQLIGDRLSFLNILLDRGVAHQSVFARKNILRKYPFNLNYKAVADQDFMLKVRRKGYLLKYIDKVICYYDGMGFSSSDESIKHSLVDRMSMLKESEPIIYAIRQLGHFFKTGGIYKV